MEQTGVVMAVQAQEASVRFTRSKMCAHCGGCMMIGDNEAQVTLPNTLHAQVGDLVRVELHAKSFVGANLLAYGIPLVLLLLGVGAGSLAGNAWGAAGGIAGVALGYLILRLLEPRFARMGKFQPRMISIENE